MTLQTVADRVGVSRMTVSNAFSRPDQLSAELRQRILDVADELGYAGPDPAARALARGTTGSVGVLLTDSLHYAFTDEVAAQFLGAIARELEVVGLALTLLSSNGPEGVVPPRDVPMDGALVYSCETDSPAVEWLHRRKLPVVYVDQTPIPGISSINVDDRAGAVAAAEHVLALGHRRVGLVVANHTGPNGIVEPADARIAHVSTQRLHGWSEPLRAAGVAPVLVQVDDSSDEAGLHAAALLLDLPEPPTAILCFSDTIAYGVVQTAHERGMRVPDDLSVVGFDDSQLASRMRPALTTVRQDVLAKGRAAASELRITIERARDGGTHRARRILLPTELVVRDSTAAAPSR